MRLSIRQPPRSATGYMLFPMLGYLVQRGLFQRFHGDQQSALADLQRYLALAHDPNWRAEAERQIAMIQTEREERETPPDAE